VNDNGQALTPLHVSSPAHVGYVVTSDMYRVIPTLVDALPTR
jgi:hypothetical protein